jgi:hypothetical protein
MENIIKLYDIWKQIFISIDVNKYSKNTYKSILLKTKKPIQQKPPIITAKIGGKISLTTTTAIWASLNLVELSFWVSSFSLIRKLSGSELYHVKAT